MFPSSVQEEEAHLRDFWRHFSIATAISSLCAVCSLAASTGASLVARGRPLGLADTFLAVALYKILAAHVMTAAESAASVAQLRVAFRRFDLDHIGPEIAQELGGVGGEENMAQFHNAHPVEHLKHDSLPPVLSSVPATRRGKRL